MTEILNAEFVGPMPEQQGAVFFYQLELLIAPIISKCLQALEAQTEADKADSLNRSVRHTIINTD